MVIARLVELIFELKSFFLLSSGGGRGNTFKILHTQQDHDPEQLQRIFWQLQHEEGTP